MGENINRKAIVSGRFYPNKTTELKLTLKECFSGLLENSFANHTNAIISPHAGYAFSGKIAASAFAQISPNTVYKNVFIIAPSHHESFTGASVYNKGNYETPLGEVLVNIELASKLIAKSSKFSFYANAHKHEHAIEVQLPFLQYWLNQVPPIIPILVGSKEMESLEQIAEVLKPYFTKENLFIISSDFSHFPNYKNALLADKHIGDAILTKDIKQVQKAVKTNKKLFSNNIATSACGLSAIYILLFLMQKDKEIILQKIAYKNSGDSIYGDKSRVVGYMSFAAKANNTNNEFELTIEEQKHLIKRVKQSIINRLNHESQVLEDPKVDQSFLFSKCGAFVSVYVENKLRGCIGRFSSDTSLFKLVEILAISAAFHDSRFNPITLNELQDITIEISVLSPLKKIQNVNEVIIGKHGIYIKQGRNKGTLLPQVALKNNWNAKQFIEYCSVHKAGLKKNTWKNADLYTYTAQIFEG